MKKMPLLFLSAAILFSPGFIDATKSPAQPPKQAVKKYDPNLGDERASNLLEVYKQKRMANAPQINKRSGIQLFKPVNAKRIVFHSHIPPSKSSTAIHSKPASQISSKPR